MPIHCPHCGTTHDVVEFEAGHKIKCRCGQELDLSLYETVDDFLRYFENEEEREKAKEIQQDAQVICQMILNENCPEVDIEIAKEKLREKVKGLFPDLMDTYRMIYEARFKRLWEQFRS
jgi:DNA-binding transcriptional regulator GbsR (MarR family)